MFQDIDNILSAALEKTLTIMSCPLASSPKSSYDWARRMHPFSASPARCSLTTDDRLAFINIMQSHRRGGGSRGSRRGVDFNHGGRGGFDVGHNGPPMGRRGGDFNHGGRGGFDVGHNGLPMGGHRGGSHGEFWGSVGRGRYIGAHGDGSGNCGRGGYVDSGHRECGQRGFSRFGESGVSCSGRQATVNRQTGKPLRPSNSGRSRPPAPPAPPQLAPALREQASAADGSHGVGNKRAVVEQLDAAGVAGNSTKAKKRKVALGPLCLCSTAAEVENYLEQCMDKAMKTLFILKSQCAHITSSLNSCVEGRAKLDALDHNPLAVFHEREVSLKEQYIDVLEKHLQALKTMLASPTSEAVVRGSES